MEGYPTQIHRRILEPFRCTFLVNDHSSILNPCPPLLPLGIWFSLLLFCLSCGTYRDNFDSHGTLFHLCHTCANIPVKIFTITFQRASGPSASSVPDKGNSMMVLIGYHQPDLYSNTLKREPVPSENHEQGMKVHLLSTDKILAPRSSTLLGVARSAARPIRLCWPCELLDPM